VANIDEIKARLRKALDDNDLDALFSITAELKKEQAAAAEKDREARLAKAKTATAVIQESIDKLVQVAANREAFIKLAEVYGKDRSVSIVIPLDDIASASVMPLERARVGRVGGGGGGRTKDEYGMNLDTVFQSFATAEEKTELAKLQGEHSKDHRTDGTQHVLKTRVKNRAVQQGLLKSVTK